MQPGLEELKIYNHTYEVRESICAPVSKVWHQHLDTGSWVTSHRIETLHGQPGTEGAINRVSFKRVDEFKMPPPHYHYVKIIKLIPNRQYTIKTYSEKGGSYGWNITAFDDVRFNELTDDSTEVVFNLYIEIRCEAAEKDPASLDLSMKASRDGMIENLARLKRLVEAG